MRTDSYWGLLRLANAASALSPADLPPTLLVFGTEDGIVPFVSLCALARGLDSDDAVRLHEGAGHRLLHEREPDAIRAQIEAWLGGASPDDVPGEAPRRFCARR
ncbi:MAG: hypothetical protein ACOCYE_12165 [Pseudomonadota bacterium]